MTSTAGILLLSVFMIYQHCVYEDAYMYDHDVDG